jgi:carbon storage regulator CsrA
MLVLSRREGERVMIRVGDVRVWVEVVECKHKIRLGFKAPADVLIMRQELIDSTEPTRRNGHER